MDSRDVTLLVDAKDMDVTTAFFADDDGSALLVKKKRRRVSFARTQTVHFIPRNDEIETPPDTNSAVKKRSPPPRRSPRLQAMALGSPLPHEESAGLNGKSAEPEQPTCDMDTGSQGSWANSESAMDGRQSLDGTEEDSGCPVQLWHISHAEEEDSIFNDDLNGDITMDATTFTKNLSMFLNFGTEERTSGLSAGQENGTPPDKVLHDSDLPSEDMALTRVSAPHWALHNPDRYSLHADDNESDMSLATGTQKIVWKGREKLSPLKARILNVSSPSQQSTGNAPHGRSISLLNEEKENMHLQKQKSQGFKSEPPTPASGNSSVAMSLSNTTEGFRVKRTDVLVDIDGNSETPMSRRSSHNSLVDPSLSVSEIGNTVAICNLNDLIADYTVTKTDGILASGKTFGMPTSETKDSKLPSYLKNKEHCDQNSGQNGGNTLCDSTMELECVSFSPAIVESLKSTGAEAVSAAPILKLKPLESLLDQSLAISDAHGQSFAKVDQYGGGFGHEASMLAASPVTSRNQTTVGGHQNSKQHQTSLMEAPSSSTFKVRAPESTRHMIMSETLRLSSNKGQPSELETSFCTISKVIAPNTSVASTVPQQVIGVAAANIHPVIVTPMVTKDVERTPSFPKTNATLRNDKLLLGTGQEELKSKGQIGGASPSKALTILNNTAANGGLQQSAQSKGVHVNVNTIELTPVGEHMTSSNKATHSFGNSREISNPKLEVTVDFFMRHMEIGLRNSQLESGEAKPPVPLSNLGNLKDHLQFSCIIRPQMDLYKEHFHELGAKVEFAKMRNTEIKQSRVLIEKLSQEPVDELKLKFEKWCNAATTKWILLMINYEMQKRAYFDEFKDNLQKESEAANEQHQAVAEFRKNCLQVDSKFLLKISSQTNSALHNIVLNLVTSNSNRETQAMDACEQIILIRGKLDAVQSKIQEKTSAYREKLQIKDSKSIVPFIGKLEVLCRKLSAVNRLLQQQEMMHINMKRGVNGKPQTEFFLEDFFYQRFEYEGAGPSAQAKVFRISNMEELERAFPCMDASLAFQQVANVVQNTNTVQVQNLHRLVQRTNYLFGSLLDLLKEIKYCRRVFRVRMASKFLLRRDELALRLTWLESASGIKVTLMFDMRCVRGASYPLDLKPVEVQVHHFAGQQPSSQVTVHDVNLRITKLKPGSGRIYRICGSLEKLMKDVKQGDRC